MIKSTYINLPIKSVAETDAFFEKLDLKRIPEYCSKDTTNVVINDNTYLMLLEDSRFKHFTQNKIDLSVTNTMVALQFDTRPEIDEFVDKAVSAGATETVNPEPVDFMYGRSFVDINGHRFECFTILK